MDFNTNPEQYANTAPQGQLHIRSHQQPSSTFIDVHRFSCLPKTCNKHSAARAAEQAGGMVVQMNAAPHGQLESYIRAGRCDARTCESIFVSTTVPHASKSHHKLISNSGALRNAMRFLANRLHQFAKQAHCADGGTPHM